MKVIVFTWSFFCPDIIDVLRRLGAQVLDVPRLAADFAARAYAAVRECKPDVFFSMNFNPALSQLARETKLPYLAWNFDVLMNSIFCDPRYAHPLCYVFCIEQASCDRYRKAGYPHVYYQPIACNLRRVERAIAAAASRGGVSPQAEIVFIGDSMKKDEAPFDNLLDNLTRQLQTERDARGQAVLRAIAERIQSIYAAECEDFFRPALQERLADASRKLGFDLASALSKDPEFFHVVIGKKVSAQKRQACVCAAAAVVPVAVYGDEFWRTLGENGLQWFGRADYLAATP